jgi:hypothetical protein
MNLQFFLGDKLIATIPIDNASMNNPLYLPGVKAELQEKYKNIIEGSKATPGFYVEAASSVNDRRISVNNPPLVRKIS